MAEWSDGELEFIGGYLWKEVRSAFGMIIYERKICEGSFGSVRYKLAKDYVLYGKYNG